MTAEIREKIMEEYRALRQQNAREERRRLEEAFQKDPRIEQMVTARHEMILSGVRSAFTMPETTDLEKKMKDYNQKIRALLAENGFPENYLEPVYACEKCRDTGFYGEPIREECVCFKRRAAQYGDKITSAEQTFEQFDETVFSNVPLEGEKVSQRDLMRVIRSICEKYADDFPNQLPPDMLLYGGSGLGKTYLLSCIASRVRQRGFEVVCTSAYAMLASLRSAYFARSAEADPLFHAQLLLIDDLGMEPLMENITVEQIYNLLNERRKHGLPTVISTNLSIKDMKQRYTERVSSRVLDAGACRVVHLLGKDVRLTRR